MVSDPASYFVIFIDRVRRLLNIGHYQNNGVLTTVIEGHSAAKVYMTAIERELLTRLNHAAYLGRELARAEHALSSGEAYVQDAALGSAPATALAIKTETHAPATSA